MIWLLSLAALFVLPQAGGKNDSDIPTYAVRQPVAFSHKGHTELGLKCLHCHDQAPAAARAGLPELSLCMSCHRGIPPKTPELKKLAGFANRKEEIGWKRIYEVPYYVFFHHGNHVRATVECNSCHGEVQRRDVLWQEGDISMKACIDCHRSRGVSTECHLCHELNQ